MHKYGNDAVNLVEGGSLLLHIASSQDAVTDNGVLTLSKCGLKIISIEDQTGISYNGCRLSKKTSRRGHLLPTLLTYLVHGSSWGHHLHDVSPASISPNRQPPANDLAKGSQVWGDAKVLLCTPAGYSEACHNFVKAQQGAILLGDVLQTLYAARTYSQTCIVPVIMLLIRQSEAVLRSTLAQ